MKVIKSLIPFVLMLSMSPLTSAQEFTVGVEDLDYFPLYAYKDGAYKGLAREILDKFAEKKGHKFKYKPFPVIRLTSYFVEGKVDLKFPDNAFWASDVKKGKDVKYSGPVVEYTDGVMVLPGKVNLGVEKLLKLGIVRGFTPWDYMGLLKSGAVTSKEASSLQSLIQQTLHGRVDGAYFNVQVASYYLKNELKQPGSLVFDDSLPHTTSTYTLSSIEHPGLIEEFSQFLIDEAGWVTDVTRKYLGQ